MERQPLTRELIVTKAVEIIDREGVDALSMRRLGSELGVQAMALYYHFPNRQTILDGVAGAVVAEAAGDALLPADPEMQERIPGGVDARKFAEGPEWRQTMKTGILAVHRAMQAHPNVAPLLTALSPESMAAVTWVEGPLAILASAGFEGERLVAAYHQILAYSFGWHLMAARDVGGMWSNANETTMPLTEIAPTAAALGDTLGDWSFGFEQGLDIVLDGIETQRLRPSPTDS